MISSLPVSAYNVQSGDNRLLTSIYNSIDKKIASGDHKEMIALYEMMDALSIRYSNNEKSMYFLNKMDEYLGERLFRATKASDFVCLASHVQQWDTVTLWYDLRSDNWLLVSIAQEKNVYEQPIELVFNAGKQQIVRGVDQAVLGMSIASRKNIMLNASQAYGEWHEGYVEDFPRQVIEPQAKNPLVAGQKFTATFINEDWAVVMKSWVIYSLDAETVRLDFNHPLASQAISGVIAVKGLFKKCQLQ